MKWQVVNGRFTLAAYIQMWHFFWPCAISKRGIFEPFSVFWIWPILVLGLGYGPGSEWEPVVMNPYVAELNMQPLTSSSDRQVGDYETTWLVGGVDASLGNTAKLRFVRRRVILTSQSRALATNPIALLAGCTRKCKLGRTAWGEGKYTCGLKLKNGQQVHVMFLFAWFQLC